MQNNADIIKFCGGTLEVAYHTKVHQVTVERWARGFRLIPSRYWRIIVNLSNGAVTIEQLQKLNSK